MTIEPLYNRIVVEPDVAKNTTEGGLVIPDSVSGQGTPTGTVVAVGAGIVLENGEVHSLHTKPGDRVTYSVYGGTPVCVDGKNYLILREDEDVLAILHA